MTDDPVSIVLIFTAAAWGVLFMIQYILRRPWRTPAGRLVLAFMGVIAVLLVLAVLRRYIGDDASWLWVRRASWLAVNIIMGGAAIVLWRSGRRATAGPSSSHMDSEAEL